jgi:hypothetical protein
MTQQGEPPTVTVPIEISRHITDQLRSEARRRGLGADELASQILANVIADDLFLAVLER